MEDVNISELKDNPNLLPGSRGLRLIGDYRNLKAESDETLEDPAEEEEEEEEEEDEEEKEPCGGRPHPFDQDPFLSCLCFFFFCTFWYHFMHVYTKHMK